MCSVVVVIQDQEEINVPALTIVTLTDDDGDEFPVALPGVFRDNRAGDKEAALAVAADAIRRGELRPRGELTVAHIEYRGA